MRITQYLLLVIAFVAVITSIFFSPILPDKIASHWNLVGEVDGYMPKLFGLLFVPIIIVVIASLSWWMPKLDKRIEQFITHADILIILFSLFLLFIHLQILLWSSGTEIAPNKSYPIALGALFIYIGYLFRKSSRNWLIGIRTPWTLASDYVWQKTHQLGSFLFIASGVITMIGTLFPQFALYFVIAPIVVSVILLFIYSYLLSKKENK